MRITVRVQPNSSQEKVELHSNGTYKVWVHATPTDGQANNAVITLLAKYLGKPKSALQLVVGQRSRDKHIDVKN